MKHLFVPYEIAKQLKEKGFDEPCLGWYQTINGKEAYIPKEKEGEFHFTTSSATNSMTDNVFAPLYQQVVDWLREKHNHFIYVNKVKNYPQCYKSFIESTEIIESDGYYFCLLKAIETALTLI